IVRRDEERLAVTLVEGKVTVAPARLVSNSTLPDHDLASAQTPGVAPRQRSREVFTLSPGERLTFGASTSPRLDRPPLDRVTAWRRGQVEFDDTPLADAAAEMNRYSASRLVIENPQTAALRVNGVFRAGDTGGF